MMYILSRIYDFVVHRVAKGCSYSVELKPHVSNFVCYFVFNYMVKFIFAPQHIRFDCDISESKFERILRILVVT